MVSEFSALPVEASTAEAPRGSILLLEDDPDLAELITIELESAGYAVAHAEDGAVGLKMLDAALPDLIVSDVMMPNMDGRIFVAKLRADPRLRVIPVVLLTTMNRLQDIVAGFEVGADDYVLKPFRAEELLARVNAKMVRPPVPLDELSRDRQTGLLSEAAFDKGLAREWQRARRGNYPGLVACLAIDELVRLRARLGPAADAAIAAHMARMLVSGTNDPLVSFGRARDGSYLMLLPGHSPELVRERLALLAQQIVSARFPVGPELVRLTPSIGYAAFEDAERAEDLLGMARLASDHAAAHLDLQPSRYTAAMAEAAAEKKRLPSTFNVWAERLRLPLQMAGTFAIAWAIPFALYFAADAAGWDISWAVYVAVSIMIVLTALLIWIEGVLAMRRFDPPRAETYAPASAIIAAYLPNEAATLESTIEAFLRVQYPTPVQIILAYNTPKDMPFEQVLHDIAIRDPRFVPIRVVGSTSKAQNVNAALSRVTGEFVGVFDADHQPDPNSFCRAWDWLASGYDVVQGHCFIRNADASWVARMVAIEFEQIYCVSHPGRARLHGFGIFGGSNGYWKTKLLRSVRMHGFMLTEDIDSSLRVIENGGKIRSDRYLISRELAPTDLNGLTNQRLRWAQGWFQVSLKRLWPMLRSRHLSLRQKLGAIHLLAWREIFPWVSLQIFPIIAFWGWRAGGLDQLDWFVPLLFVLTVSTLATGPGQIAFTYLLADPEHKKHKSWFAHYLAMSFFFYSEYKNLLGRVGQIKEFMSERAWKVTPRTGA